MERSFLRSHESIVARTQRILPLVQRPRTIAIACLSMVAFGIVLASLGASLPNVIARFGLDKRQAGGLLSLLNFSVLPASLVFGPIVDRRGYKGMLVLSFAAITIGLEIIAFAPSLAWMRAGIILTAFSGGLVNGASNALVADVSGERRGEALTFVGGFFGVGAAGVPLVLAVFAGRIEHAAILAAVGVFVVVPFLVTAFSAFPAPKHPQGFPIARARALLRDPVLLVMGLILFLESGMESTVGGWTTTFFAEDLGVSVERVPIYLALFWLGLMVTRLTLGVLLRWLSPVRVLFVGVGIAVTSAFVLLATHSVVVAGTAVFLLGCGCAPTFPVLYGFVGDRYTEISGTALSLVIAMALLGGILMPYVTGVVGATYGLRSAFAIVPGALVLLGVLLVIVVRDFAARRNQRQFS